LRETVSAKFEFCEILPRLQLTSRFAGM
jgi:hypothetical protein